MSELERAMAQTKIGKATGPDDILPEMLLQIYDFMKYKRKPVFLRLYIRKK